ncbi:MAG: hypothetical protein WCS56_02330 [Bacilli bacterium]
MISEQDLKEMESLDLTGKISRITSLLKGREQPRSFELGILLALKMANEIREGKALGEDTAAIVAEWTQKYPESVVEEAIAHAKEFLLHSETLIEKLRKGILKENVSVADPPNA